MESTAAKKKQYKNVYFIFWDIFILFVIFFQSYYLIVYTQKVATHCKEQNKKESWQVVKKQKSYSKSKNVKEMPKKLKFFSLKIHKCAGI